MGRVFISYSRKDREPVDNVYQAMCKEGVDAWLDRQDIKAGSLWKKEIVTAIDTCPAFVLMLSPNSAASDNVRREIDLAQDAERPILPLMLDPVNTPLPPLIRGHLEKLEPIDAVQLGFQNAVGQLIQSLRGHVENLQVLVESAVRRVEVVLQGETMQSFTPEKQAQLLEGLAPLAGAAASQLVVTGLEPGSLHVFIEMPAEAAYELKTQALNRDRRFKKLKIVSLRLAGNRKFVNTSLGLLTATATLTFWQQLWLRTPALLAKSLGMTAGKILTIAVAASLVAGAALAAPAVIGPSVAPVPTSTSTPTAAPRPFTRTPLPVQPPAAAATLTPLPTLTGELTPTLTATPADPVMARDGLCWFGPGPDYEVVGVLRKGTSVELVGPGALNGWLVIVYPGTNANCWVEDRYVQVDPALGLESMQEIQPPPRPTVRVRNTAVPSALPSMTPTVDCGLDPYNPNC